LIGSLATYAATPAARCRPDLAWIAPAYCPGAHLLGRIGQRGRAQFRRQRRRLAIPHDSSGSNAPTRAAAAPSRPSWGAPGERCVDQFGETWSLAATPGEIQRQTAGRQIPGALVYKLKMRSALECCRAFFCMRISALLVPVARMFALPAIVSRRKPIAS